MLLQARMLVLPWELEQGIANFRSIHFIPSPFFAKGSVPKQGEKTKIIEKVRVSKKF